MVSLRRLRICPAMGPPSFGARDRMGGKLRSKVVPTSFLTSSGCLISPDVPSLTGWALRTVVAPFSVEYIHAVSVQQGLGSSGVFETSLVGLLGLLISRNPGALTSARPPVPDSFFGDSQGGSISTGGLVESSELDQSNHCRCLSAPDTIVSTSSPTSHGTDSGWWAS